MVAKRTAKKAAAAVEKAPAEKKADEAHSDAATIVSAVGNLIQAAQNKPGKKGN